MTSLIRTEWEEEEGGLVSARYVHDDDDYYDDDDDDDDVHQVRGGAKPRHPRHPLAGSLDQAGQGQGAAAGDDDDNVEDNHDSNLGE